MANITVLDQNTTNKTAAGEVIEWPASVVKELPENVIDTQATAMTMEIKDGGCSMVRVTDNGCGILRDQIALASLRHATSKIRSVEDFFTVSSLGFRGEALTSIAVVAQVEPTSKTSDDLTDLRYQIEGGAGHGLEEIGAPGGTTIITRNLLYDTPTRKEFLRTPMTEGAHVVTVVEKIVLSHPDISIRFIQNNQNKLYTSGNHNSKDLIYTVFGREIISNLLAINAQEGDVQVSGFTGEPVIARSNRSYENYLTNRCYTRSSVISKATEEVYKPFTMQHRYSFTMLHFTIQQDTLDVDVHSTKMELRPSDRKAVYRVVVKAVADVLAHKELIPEVSLAEKKEKEVADLTQRLSFRSEPFGVKRRESMNRAAQPAAQDKASLSVSYARTPPPKPSYVNELISEWPKARKREQEAVANAMKDSNATQNTVPTFSEKLQDTNKTDSTSNRYIGDKQDQVPTLAEDQSNASASREPEQLDLFGGKLLDPKARPRYRLIGQLFDTYWTVEYSKQLFIIDQHAAHEKVLYEKAIETLKTRQYDTRVVEPSITLTLNMNEEVLLSRYMSYSTGMGFEIEPFGGREYVVRGVPANLFSIAWKELLIEMIGGLSDDISVHNPDIIYRRVASMPCKVAVKGHHSLSIAEANESIDQLLQLDNPYACPYGGPTIIPTTKYELEKKFKRIVQTDNERSYGK